MIIGITGPTGSGKTTLLRLLEERGALVLDCDRVYHELLETSEALNSALCRHFPPAAREGRISRPLLAPLVYGDPEALETLNRITHAAICREVERRLENAPALAAIDAIALLESGLGALCDLTVAVVAPEDIRVRRLVARDGITEDHARSRIAAQKSADWFREQCDCTLENSGTREEFEAQCRIFISALIIKN